MNRFEKPGAESLSSKYVFICSVLCKCKPTQTQYSLKYNLHIPYHILIVTSSALTYPHEVIRAR